MDREAYLGWENCLTLQTLRSTPTHCYRCDTQYVPAFDGGDNDLCAYCFEIEYNSDIVPVDEFIMGRDK